MIKAKMNCSTHGEWVRQSVNIKHIVEHQRQNTSHMTTKLMLNTNKFNNTNNR